MRVTTANYIGHNATLPVRRPGQRDEAPLAGDEVLHFDGITDGENIGITGVHLIIHADAAALPDFQSGYFRQSGIGTNAQGENHNVGRVGFSGLGLDIDLSSRCLLESRYAVVERQMHAVPLQVGFDHMCVFGVEHGQYLVEHLDQRDLEAAVHQVLDHLQADEAPPTTTARVFGLTVWNPE